MDPNRMREAYQKLQSLDERLTHKIRPRGGGSLIRPSAEQIELVVRDLASYTVELKEVLQELILALATKPPEAPR